MELIATEVDEKKLSRFRMFVVRKYKEYLRNKRVQGKFKRWTKQAFECYKLNYDCDNCAVKSVYGITNCKMKESVETLIHDFGYPEQFDPWYN